jgi:hypothetical protein
MQLRVAWSCLFKSLTDIVIYAGKYSTKYRSNFRFRSLHVVLLDCFALLPLDSYLNSFQSVYVEALRVFRDAVGSGFEGTCISNFVSEEFLVLFSYGISVYRTGGIASAGSIGLTLATSELLQQEHILMLKLESNSVALQRKESEAFLSVCSSVDGIGSGGKWW